MDTPVCDFVRRYAEGDPLRLHMPGHKGREVLGPEALDITEIPGADVLYHAQGVLRQSEENAAGLFGAGRTLYSTEGSSLCVRAMVYLAMLYAKMTGRRAKIAAGRNAHKSFLTAAALLDLEIVWLFPPEGGSLLSCPVEPQELNGLLSGEDAPAAVYVTAPDYLGNLPDIGALAEVCHRHGALLLVDNAHGAYLHFLPRPCHPMDLGADLCCDSAHKTLPVLTPGAYLHLAETLPAALRAQAESAMALFASTSPSYLILQSLDGANRYLAGDFRERLGEFAQQVSRWKERLAARGWTLMGQEPLKLTIASKALGYRGEELAGKLAEKGIICEFSDPDFVVMMLTPELGLPALQRVEKALAELERRAPILETPPPLPVPRRVLSPRQALLEPREELEIGDCLGRVLADANVSCPPAIPILACGEEIDEGAIRCFRYYGLERAAVVR